jgi:hypothetical protein
VFSAPPNIREHLPHLYRDMKHPVCVFVNKFEEEVDSEEFCIRDWRITNWGDDCVPDQYKQTNKNTKDW